MSATARFKTAALKRPPGQLAPEGRAGNERQIIVIAKGLFEAAVQFRPLAANMISDASDDNVDLDVVLYNHPNTGDFAYEQKYRTETLNQVARRASEESDTPVKILAHSRGCESGVEVADQLFSEEIIDAIEMMAPAGHSPLGKETHTALFFAQALGVLGEFKMAMQILKNKPPKVKRAGYRVIASLMAVGGVHIAANWRMALDEIWHIVEDDTTDKAVALAERHVGAVGLILCKKDRLCPADTAHNALVLKGFKGRKAIWDTSHLGPLIDDLPVYEELSRLRLETPKAA